MSENEIDDLTICSSLWTSQAEYQPWAYSSGIDFTEMKSAMYWQLPFTQMRFGMSWNGATSWISNIAYNAAGSSMWAQIQDGAFRSFNMARWQWLQLANGGSLEANCS